MSLQPLTRDVIETQPSEEAADTLIKRIRDAEIEGLGGGKFPTAEKLLRAESGGALIVNGLQSEPDNLVDTALLAQCTRDVIAGIGAAALAADASSINLALPAGIDAELVRRTQETLQSELDWLNSFRAKELNARQVHLTSDHATGEEHALAHELGLIDEPSSQTRRIPLTQLGALCLNLATCYAIGRAVYQGETLSSRLVFVNGEAQWLSFGTPINKILTPAWINGRHGGYAASGQSVDAAIFCITSPPNAPSAPCINCGQCEPVCPASLAPQELYAPIELGKAPSDALRLEDCIECGACNAVCPSGLWLTQAFREAKHSQRQKAHDELHAQKAKARVEARNARLQRVAEERDARLKSRGERKNRSW